MSFSSNHITEATYYDILRKCLRRRKKNDSLISLFQSFTHHFIKLPSGRNILFYSSQSPQGPTGRWNLLLKLPSYLTKYHQNISSQIESRPIEVPLYHTPWHTMKQIFHYQDISKVKHILSGKRFTRVLHRKPVRHRMIEEKTPIWAHWWRVMLKSTAFFGLGVANKSRISKKIHIEVEKNHRSYTFGKRLF